MPAASLMGLFPAFGFGGTKLMPATELNTLALETCGSGTTIPKAGGGQIGATPANFRKTKATPVTANDSISLPPALPGMEREIINTGTVSLQVYGAASNPSNGGAPDVIATHAVLTPIPASNVGVAQASGAVALYKCFELGIWRQCLLT